MDYAENYIFKTDNYGEDWDALSPDQIDISLTWAGENPITPPFP